MGQRRYQADGFIPIVSPPARVTRDMAAAVVCVKGDIMIDDGSGYATNTATDFAATVLGVCAASKTGGTSDGDEAVEIYPLDDKTLYIVPVSGSTAITADAVGTYVDLNSNDEVDITDIVSSGIAFFIEDFDASTEAVAANTAGYAIGRFRHVMTQTS